MSPSRVLVLALAALLPVLCSAQWRWVDKSGRTVFSDQPPPPDVPAANIVKRPGNTRAAAEPAAPASQAAAPLHAASSAVKPTGKDKELEQKKKQAEAAEEEKKKAYEQEVARVQAANCKRAQLGKATLDSGVRVARTNEKGEREFLDDEQRAAEIRRLEQVIATDCKGG
jgi:transcriptional regulator of acetoin/glycerol metabolism